MGKRIHHCVTHKQYEWLNYCDNCGTLCLENRNHDGECPPWGSTVEGENTNAKRTYEAGEVEELKNIQAWLLRCKETHHSRPWDSVKYREEALVLLQQLIQKREGSDRD